jgi:thermostable 8-oxoguanine DNA glycosylase
MLAAWTFEPSSLEKWSLFIQVMKRQEFVKDRIQKNVRREGIDLSRAEVWKALVGCQVTSIQKSGPGSLVKKFMGSSSTVLKYSRCRDSDGRLKLIESEIRNAGLRFANKIASNLEYILTELESGGWKVLLEKLESLRARPSIVKERTVVEFLMFSSFPGLGPKQARNLVQRLGLSRYEIPLDSRILRKLKEFGANFVPGPSGLSDYSVYLFVQEGLQALAKELSIYPCVLDACIFASTDTQNEEP